jgi:hypothetical protein
MPDDIFMAYERAIELVGADVWEKLSNHLQTTILDAELTLIATEREPTPMLQPLGPCESF